MLWIILCCIKLWYTQCITQECNREVAKSEFVSLQIIFIFEQPTPLEMMESTPRKESNNWTLFLSYQIITQHWLYF